MVLNDSDRTERDNVFRLSSEPLGNDVEAMNGGGSDEGKNAEVWVGGKGAMQHSKAGCFERGCCVPCVHTLGM